ncbi:MAG: choice-of-anchor Q domain-containing protein [Dokdonella sp.]|uniref:choice-of-anchor Q domain-containing protein n=1 Tax=Dokdonella sp. TaxID=2291710 RepID=UPI0032670DC9
MVNDSNGRWDDIRLSALAVGLAVTLSSQTAADAKTPFIYGGSTLLVANCDDDGVGSLRAALALAANGDTIDLSQLTCGTITLTTGELHTFRNLTLRGPGSGELTITAGSGSRVLRHAGSGTMVVSGVTLADGTIVSNTLPGDTAASGGCIAAASLSMSDVVVSGCIASDVHVPGVPSPGARGGGIYVGGSVTLDGCRVIGNTAEASNDFINRAFGGGLYVGGNFDIRNSTISGNATDGTHHPFDSIGGGMYTRGGGVIQSTTISDNYAYYAGAARLNSFGIAKSIRNVTVSGNSAVAWTGGIVTDGSSLEISNSTFAFNHAQTLGPPGAPAFGGAGLLVFGGGYTIDLESSIFANNTRGSDEDDFFVFAPGDVAGADNLVMTSNVALPADTLVADPQLAPLADNGGPTQTHALAPGSAALDVGNNLASFDFDQRGTGYERVSGPRPDIGAFEWQQSDTIFVNSFEGALR